MKTNVQRSAVHTHEGARASHVSPIETLRRSMLSCLLWENEFYEDGESIADRIASTASLCKPEDVAALAIEARSKGRLRHAPLWLAVALAKGRGKLVGDTIRGVIQRADELAEFLSLYWRDGKRPISKQVKRGLAMAFNKFTPYQLAKYNRDGAIKLRDVMFLVHPKPLNAEQELTWKQLVDGTLPAADTWENRLSGGQDKRESFEAMLREGKLGYMALLRNLRNMKELGVPKGLVAEVLLSGAANSKALPFRYFAAAQAVPGWEGIIDAALIESLAAQTKMPGRTLLVIDRSGSMEAALSRHSKMDRMSAAIALGAIIVGTSEECTVFATAGNDGDRRHATAEVPARAGMALRDAVAMHPIGYGGIYLNQCMDYIHEQVGDGFDRVIVITDEADCDHKLTPETAKQLGRNNYIINVASHKNGIAYSRFTHINGFSESVVEFIRELESTQSNTQADDQ